MKKTSLSDVRGDTQPNLTEEKQESRQAQESGHNSRRQGDVFDGAADAPTGSETRSEEISAPGDNEALLLDRVLEKARLAFENELLMVRAALFSLILSLPCVTQPLGRRA